MNEPLLTCGLLTQSTIYSIFKEQTGTTISPATSINALLKRKVVALSRYGRFGGFVSIVSILPICLDMAGLSRYGRVGGMAELLRELIVSGERFEPGKSY